MVEYGFGYDSWNWTSAILLGISVLALVIPAFSECFWFAGCNGESKPLSELRQSSWFLSWFRF